MMGGNRGGRNFTIHTKNDGRREFYQHDDRGYSESRNTFASKHDDRGYSDNRNTFASNPKQKYSINRVGGQPWQGSGGAYNRGPRRGQGTYRGGQRKYYEEDIQMGEGKARHQQFYENARGRRGRKNNRGRPYLVNTSAIWHKIIIKDASTFDKYEVMNVIKAHVDDDFVPIMYETEANNLCFYLEKNANVAKAILNLSNRVTFGKNQRLYISCMDASPPQRPITLPQKEIIKKVMSDRYSTEMNRLDLSFFHNDRNLLKEEIYCPLYRNQCLTVILEILTANVPLVEEIDFSNNQLCTVNEMESLKKCENLKRLILEKNRIRHMDGFLKLKGLGIIELTLEGNPVCDKFKEGESYVSAVRKFFPKVLRLDGMELPKPIGFEVDEDHMKLPPLQPSFFCSDAVKDIVVQFIEQYYQIYESDNRRPLEAAYTEDALFSLTANFPETGPGAKLTHIFLKENRNLKKIIHNEKRQKLLFKGRSSVVDVLCRLPNCCHDPNSFIIDIPIAQARLMHVVLTGVFKQSVDRNPPIRSFMRSMVIVPVGAGFCISNEELFINVATVEQIRKAFKEPVPVPVPQAVTAGPSITSTSSTDASSGLEPAQLILIQEFSVNSKMLPEFCKMCLEQNNWDFNKAGEMFLNLQKENKIPPEYFGMTA